jgi:hypothetical protein
LVLHFYISEEYNSNFMPSLNERRFILLMPTSMPLAILVAEENKTSFTTIDSAVSTQRLLKPAGKSGVSKRSEPSKKNDQYKPGVEENRERQRYGE